MSLCQYKNIFGEPGKGIHSCRILGVAAVDLLGAIIIALGIAYLFHWNFWLVLAITFLIGILCHRLFCVRTTVDKMLFSCK